MFRRLSLVVALLGSLGATAGLAKASEAELAKLQDESLAWFEHYANADADGMANLYADDALLMPPGAPPATGRAAIRAFLGEEAAKTKAAGLKLKNERVTGSGIDGDSAWISGHYLVLDASGATIDSGSYLSVHRRIHGKWLYLRDIWNSDRPPAP